MKKVRSCAFTTIFHYYMPSNGLHVIYTIPIVKNGYLEEVNDWHISPCDENSEDM